MKYELKLPLKIEIEFTGEDVGHDFTQGELQEALFDILNGSPESPYEKLPWKTKELFTFIHSFFNDQRHSLNSFIKKVISHAITNSILGKDISEIVNDDDSKSSSDYHIMKKYFEREMIISLDDGCEGCIWQLNSCSHPSLKVKMTKKHCYDNICHGEWKDTEKDEKIEQAKRMLKAK